MDESRKQTYTLSLTDWLVDAVIALGAFGFSCLQLTLAANLLFPDEVIRQYLGIQTVMPSQEAFVLVALSTLPVIFRRKAPGITLAIVLGCWAAAEVLMPSVDFSLVGVLVALFTVAMDGTRAEGLVACGASVATVFLVMFLTASPTSSLFFYELLQNEAFVALSALGGYALHVRQDYYREVEERAHAAELTRESEAQRRVEEERVRIAREVHDITAHSLSAVSIQAAVAERLIDTDTAQAKEAIISVRKTSKQALDEIRAMIGVLRTGSEPAETAPTQGCDRMGDLVEYLEGAGVQTSLEMQNYDRDKVPAYIDVALFGIAREASTNIVRHAQATHATLSLETLPGGEPSKAILTVTDDGRGFSYYGIGMPGVHGHGLEGMQERVSLLHGVFATRNMPQGGFSIKVEVPLGEGSLVAS